MATQAQVTVNNNGYGIASWSALTENETGDAVDVGHWAGIKTVQIVVNNAAGESVTIQGSIDGVTWFTLNALEYSAGTYIDLTALSANAMYGIVENPRFIRPVMTNVGGSGADFDVIIGANTRL